MTFGVEPIEPGDALDLFNRADPSCEACGGVGAITVPDDDPFGTPGERWPCRCVTPMIDGSVAE